MKNQCEDITELEIQGICNRMKREKEIQRMYHYTSMDTFFKIVKDVKDGIFTFRAGSVYTMNDRQEMKLGYDYIKKIIPEIDKKRNISPEDRFLHYTTEIEKNKNIEENFGDWLINDDTTCFVVSFSKTPDILPMWSLYGDKGAGVCLEFSPDIIEQYYKTNNEKYFHIEECVYNEDMIRRFLERPIEHYYDMYLKSKVSNENVLTQKARYFATLCCTAGAYIKCPGFEYEKEIRMSVLRNKKDWQFNETSYHNRSVYVEVPIPINALTGLIVGPTANMSDVRNPIIMYLRAKGICINPVQSKIPFRLY